MAVKSWPLILSLITLALLFQSPASSAHEAPKGHLEESPTQHREHQVSKLMNKDILASFHNGKQIFIPKKVPMVPKNFTSVPKNVTRQKKKTHHQRKDATTKNLRLSKLIRYHLSP
ncbi:hypothetical protein BT93_C0105 [Corymbia citriodora subsp. variegata]|nr:hypothetical protein BT93_C0105 [Corymbia citriodora subsp. variegata]